jgi:hypothetical protein
MGPRADTFGKPLSQDTFAICAFAETLPEDELRLFVNAVQLLVVGIITAKDFQTAADHYQAGRISRKGSLSLLVDRGNPS